MTQIKTQTGQIVNEETARRWYLESVKAADERKNQPKRKKQKRVSRPNAKQKRKKR